MPNFLDISVKTRSCGCIHTETITTHGKSSTPTYSSWSKIISRCHDVNNEHYRDYGGRGIAVCDRWRKFENFLEDMGDRPIGTSIDRIDTNGNYEPSNCRWATPKEQSNNTRRCHVVTIDGISKNVSQWAESTNVRRETIFARIRAGKTGRDLIKGKENHEVH